MNKVHAALALALMTTLAACGGGSGSGDSQGSDAATQASAAPKAAPADAFGKSASALFAAEDNDFATAKGESVGDGQWKSKLALAGSAVCVLQDDKGAMMDVCILSQDLDRAAADKLFAEQKTKFSGFNGVDGLQESTPDAGGASVANYVLKSEAHGVYLVERKDKDKFAVLAMFAKPAVVDKNVNT